MITPVGKKKEQVLQGGLRNATILNQDFMQKLAITGTDEMENLGSDTDTESAGGSAGRGGSGFGDLNNIMNQSNRPGMRPNDGGQQQPNMQQSGNPGQENQMGQKTPKFDDQTGEPIAGQGIDFATVAHEIQGFVRQKWPGIFELQDLSRKGGGFTLSFGPASAGPQVVKR